jgi:hypothetical protein
MEYRVYFDRGGKVQLKRVTDFLEYYIGTCILATQLPTRPISPLVLYSNLNLIVHIEIHLTAVLVRLLAIMFLCLCYFCPREFLCILNTFSILLCVSTV